MRDLKHRHAEVAFARRCVGLEGFRQGSSGVQWEGSALWFDDCHTLLFPEVFALIWCERDYGGRALRFPPPHQPSPC
jgi:hypothetical protein